MLVARYDGNSETRNVYCRSAKGGVMEIVEDTRETNLVYKVYIKICTL